MRKGRQRFPVISEDLATGTTPEEIELLATKNMARAELYASKLTVSVEQRERTNLVNVSVRTINPVLAASGRQ